MALVLSERDYKLVTLFTKIAGIFIFAAGSVMIVDHARPWVGVGMVLLGAAVVLAPVPMTVVRPNTYPGDETPTADDGLLTVNE